jgi:hypothetical protein
MKHKFFAKSVKVAVQTDRILETANRVGIVLPSTHTALFSSVYSPIEETNDNGVRLSSEAVNKALPGIIGAQTNLEHLGYGWIVGLILDAWVNSNNEIEIIYSFAKNIYVNEYVLALEKMQKGELAVSFELLSNTNSQEHLPDGTVILNDIDFQGVGMLINETPAYKNAITYEVANQYKDRIEQNKENLVFASKIIETCNQVLAEEVEEEFLDIKWTTITTRDDQHIHVVQIDMNGDGESVGTYGDDEKQHVHKIVNYQIQETDKHAHRILEELLAKRKEEVLNMTKTPKGGEIQMNEEQIAKVAEIRAELGDLVAEFKDEDLLVEEKVEEVRKAKLDAEKATEEVKEDENEPEAKSDLDVAEEKIVELQTKVDELTATLEAKDSEIAEVSANAQKIGQLKVELKDNEYVADFKDEDYLDEAKLEKAKLQKENDDLKKANEELTKAEVKAKKDNKTPTGHVAEEVEESASTVLRNRYRK